MDGPLSVGETVFEITTSHVLGRPLLFVRDFFAALSHLVIGWRARNLRHVPISWHTKSEHSMSAKTALRKEVNTMTEPVPNRFPLTQLRRWRLSRFWTQAELATTSGVSESTIVRLEHGGSDANMTSVRKLARAFGIKPTELAWGRVPDLGPGAPETANAHTPHGA
jgi:DNA-binding XRE family transcriptional regulator